MLNTVRFTRSSEKMRCKLYEQISIMAVEIRYTDLPYGLLRHSASEASFIGPQRAPKGTVDCVTVSECLWSTAAPKSGDAHGPRFRRQLADVQCKRRSFMSTTLNTLWCVSPRVSLLARPMEFQGINPQYIRTNVHRKLEVGLSFLVTKRSVPSVFLFSSANS